MFLSKTPTYLAALIFLSKTIWLSGLELRIRDLNKKFKVSVELGLCGAAPVPVKILIH